DKLPYGHGEKSVYMISGFMKLTREEAMAIRWHMGFSGTEEKNTVSNAMESYPLVLAVSTADMEASVFMEKIGN
ncbi:MAG: hydrolase, partial [Ruminiclostridium sp.]|nr:hydrolase [Ruminiclostridium sp.]